MGLLDLNLDPDARTGLLAAGLAMMGARNGHVMQDFGQAGLLGLQAAQQSAKSRQDQMMQNLQMQTMLMDLRRRQALFDTAQKMMTDGQPSAAGPASPQLPAGSANIPSGQASAGDVQTFPLSAPGTQQPATTQQPANAQQPAIMQRPTWKQLAPPEAKAMALASGDPKTIIDLINKYTESKNGPNGLVTTFDGRPLYQSTPEGVQLFDPDRRMPAQFVPYPREATQAAANRAGAVKGAETAATEAAQFPYRTITGPFGPNGAQVTGFQGPLLGNPVPAPSSVSNRQIELSPTLSPQERAAALADAQRSGYPQMGYTVAQPGSMPGALVGADPLALKRAEGAITSQTAQNTLIGEGQGKDFLSVLESEKQAPGNIAKYQLMKDYLSKINTGKLAPSVLGLKSVAAYVAPDLAKEWTKDVPYAQAVSALSNEIALQLRNPAGGAGMPGSMSDSDRNFLVSMAAGVQNDPRAIPLMLDARIALEKRSQDIGRIARAYRAQHGTIDEGFYQQVQDFANTHPLFSGMKVPDGTTQAPAGWSIKRIN